jgi:hypothetical protein
MSLIITGEKDRKPATAHIIHKGDRVKPLSPEFLNFHGDKPKVCPISPGWRKNSASRPQGGRSGRPFAVKGNPFNLKRTPAVRVGQKACRFLPRSLPPTPQPAPLIFWDLAATVLLRKTPRLSGYRRIVRREADIKITRITGTAAASANKGRGIWHSVMAQGETSPVNHDAPRKSFYTAGKRT